MLHPVVAETLARDHQLRLLQSAERCRKMPPRDRSSSGARLWAGWWFAGRTAHGRAEQPVAHEAYLASLR
jgi:hypothetical protein